MKKWNSNYHKHGEKAVKNKKKSKFMIKEFSLFQKEIDQTVYKKFLGFSQQTAKFFWIAVRLMKFYKTSIFATYLSYCKDIPSMKT